MKRILFLLLLTVSVYGQNPSRFAKIQITGNSNSGTATKVNVQEANGEVNTKTINTAFNKNFGLNTGDVVGATTLLNQYSTTPVDWTATAFNSGQVVFYAGKQWIAKMATVAGDVPAVSSKWEEITFEALANKTVIVDAIPTDGSNNAVSSNGVFDALATKAPIVHNHTVSQITDFPTFKTIEGQSIIGTGNIDLDKNSVGLGNVDNTSDFLKPISTATQIALNTKESAIASGTISQYWRGDKTWQSFPAQATVDQTIIDGSIKAVSGNAVFDGLATKAPISSVHNPVTIGTANGLSLSTQQLSLGLASSGVTGALSGTDWNNFNSKQPALGFTPENVANKATTLTASGTAYPNNNAVIAGLATKENSFTKNTAFNKNFGTTAGTVAEGNDSRINNGQTAFSWGNHVNGGYAFTTGSNINQSSFRTALGLGSNAYTSTAYLPLTGGTVNGPVLFNSTIGGAISFQTNSLPLALMSSSQNIIGGAGSVTDFNTYVYGNNPYNIWTDGVKRVTVGGDGNTTFTGTVTASPATTANQVPTWGQVQAAARPYKVYTALLSQTGTNAPTATVLENTTGETPTLSRINVGVYIINLTSPQDKTFVLSTPSSNFVFQNIFVSSGGNNLRISTASLVGSTITPTDGILQRTPIEIRIYP